MTITVARRYQFTATHSLPGFPAPYATPHEHRYTVEVVAESDTDGAGLFDTDDLDSAWAEIAPADGDDLNPSHDITTVEGLAADWLEAMRDRLVDIVAVTVWEDGDRWGRAG